MNLPYKKSSSNVATVQETGCTIPDADSKVCALLHSQNVRTLWQFLDNMTFVNCQSSNDIALGSITSLLDQYKLMYSMLTSLQHDLKLSSTWPVVCLITLK